MAVILNVLQSPKIHPSVSSTVSVKSICSFWEVFINILNMFCGGGHCFPINTRTKNNVRDYPMTTNVQLWIPISKITKATLMMDESTTDLPFFKIMCIQVFIHFPIGFYVKTVLWCHPSWISDKENPRHFVKGHPRNIPPMFAFGSMVSGKNNLKIYIHRVPY